MTPHSNDDMPQVGVVKNGHVFTAAGWIPLRRLPPNAPPPYYAGDATHDHVFTGNEWMPLLEAQRPTSDPSVAQPRKRSRLRWVVGGAAIVLLLGIAAAIGDGQSDTPSSAAPSAEPTGTAGESSPKDWANALGLDASESKAPHAKNAPKQKKSTAPANPARVVIDGMWLHNDMKCEYNGYTSTVTGTITNTSGTAKSYVQVSFGLYDASGALLGTALANVNNLASGTDWKYSAIGAVARFATCKAADVSAF